MATPANIIDVVSDQFGVARATVAMQDRMLVTSGHRMITGRGRAARGSPEGAAALLLAVAATPLSGPGIKETAIHYERYSHLLAASPTGELVTWPLKHLKQLRAGHSLHEAVAAIIILLGRGVSQASDLFADARPDANGITTDLSMEVELAAPTPSAAIVIRAHQWNAYPTGQFHPDDNLPVLDRDRVAMYECRVEYSATFDDMQKYLETLPLHPIAGRRSPDLTQKRKFSLATLAHVAALFSDKTKL
ncbi:hypothetical protein [Bradyrhizobium sp. CW10]|uniref:hypothetical protein n=1 Tax=Bradyrhizobium sp. CW10 TaxID=2782683 RepID=UPI001FF7F185|nr:hypothetical protein [Bradyrhizobium sp. CW10]MCK1469251.1 hypothetical protein [Bradyrhizobium sp. CW10]